MSDPQHHDDLPTQDPGAGQPDEPLSERTRLQITRRVALAGGGVGLAGALLAACGGGGLQAATTGTTKDKARNRTDAAKVFGSDLAYRFTIVNHETTNPFFQPLRYGLQDACTLLGCSYDWTGSTASEIPTMLAAINRAVSDRVDGIATTLISPGAFNQPIASALRAKIPVIAYNADVPGSPRLAYIGQNLERSGELMGKQIAKLLPKGGRIALFVSTPGTSNVEPRITGLKTLLSDRPDIAITTVATGTSTDAQVAAVQNYMQLNPNLAGYFGIDAGSTSAVAQTMSDEKLEANGAVAGGFDAAADTEKLLASGQINFVIDQQPYLQGFLAILELYLYRVSDGLVGTADVDTGLKLLDENSVTAYTQTTSRFEGTSSTAGVQHS